MNRILITVCVSLFVLANALSGELDISKGFFTVPWGASPEEAVRLLSLSKDKIKKPKYHKNFDKSIELEDATGSVLYFHEGRLAFFTRKYNMGKVPDAQKENWGQVFKNRLSKVLKNNQVAQFRIMPSFFTASINGIKEKTEVYMTLEVTNLQIAKEISDASRKAAEARKKADAKKKTEIIDKACEAFLNL